MSKYRVWIEVNGDVDYLERDNFDHAQGLIHVLSNYYDNNQFGLEVETTTGWVEWEDEYGQNIHAQDIVIPA